MAKRANNPWQERFQFSYDHRLPTLTADVPDVAEVKATASFVCETNANMADSDYITIGDGSLNPALSFEYDKAGDGVTGGRVAVTAGAGTAVQTATSFVTAINAAQLAVTASNVGGTSATVTLTHDIPGTIGNAATLTENVANAGFTVSGATFTGGAAAVVATAGSFSTAETATRSIKLMTAQRAMRIDKVEYVNVTGLAGHASNYWTIALKKNTTAMASWSTATAAEGTLGANTIVNPTLSGTDANLVAAAGDVLSLSLTKAASAANLPEGRMVVHGRYV